MVSGLKSTRGGAGGGGEEVLVPSILSTSPELEADDVTTLDTFQRPARFFLYIKIFKLICRVV
ncbi:hypothetical protein E2C01_054197 [Portunus trituberculatus]|uniref:Uncharacterized protein n=1 Tax=Portunus trituberculatus TaxID=210409 RepID=A0A5B7GRD0_PORTR|nr:hypothetical protein [Portunus trituberculatus]